MVFWGTFAAVVGVPYFLFDVNYFLRFLWQMVARNFRKNRSFLEEDVAWGVCLPMDCCPQLSQMNNSRIVREIDFGRLEFWLYRREILNYIREKGGIVVHAATSINHLKPVNIFKCYNRHTKVIFWDGRFLYFEQKIITTSDNVVRSTILARQAFKLKDRLGVDEFIKAVYGATVTRPEPPAELLKWIESNEISAESLKKEDTG